MTVLKIDAIKERNKIQKADRQSRLILLLATIMIWIENTGIINIG